jgi:hypothetical protein
MIRLSRISLKARLDLKYTGSGKTNDEITSGIGMNEEHIV